MQVYIISFILTLVLMWLSEYLYKKNRIVGEVGYIISLIPNSFIAGVRDLSVGVDITTYGNNIFYDTLTFGYKYSAEVNARWGEPGYVFFNYVVSRFTDNVHVFYFILSFVGSYIAYRFFRALDSEIYVPYAMFLFSLYIYLLNLGILRQGLAISILAFSFYYFYKGNTIKGILLGVFVYLFHDSSIIIFLIYVILNFVLTIVVKKDRKYVGKLTIVAFIVAIILPLIITQLPQSIYTFIDDKYYYVANTVDFTKISYARMIIFGFPVVYFWKTIKNNFTNNKKLLFLYLIIIVNIAFSAYSGNMYVLFGRSSYYFYLPFIFFICKCIRLQQRPLKRVRDYTIFSVYAFAAFIFLMYLENYSNLFPYIMDPMIKF